MKQTTQLTNRDKARLAMVKHAVSAASGRFFTITALRKKPKTLEDGTVEHFMTLTGRTGVKKHLKGGKSTISHKDDLIGLYLSNGKGYRCFSGYLVTNITFDGNTFDFDRDRVLELKDCVEIVK